MKTNYGEVQTCFKVAKVSLVPHQLSWAFQFAWCVAFNERKEESLSRKVFKTQFENFNFNENFSYRVFWIIVLVSIIFIAINNIASVWMRFLYNSTVISIDRDYLNRNITFPPLTFCLRERLNESAVDEFLKKELNKSSSRKANKVELRKFLWNLAHFNISNLSTLINTKSNYFNVEDYLDVKFIHLLWLLAYYKKFLSLLSIKLFITTWEWSQRCKKSLPYWGFK